MLDKSGDRSDCPDSLGGFSAPPFQHKLWPGTGYEYARIVSGPQILRVTRGVDTHSFWVQVHVILTRGGWDDGCNAMYKCDDDMPYIFAN